MFKKQKLQMETVLGALAIVFMLVLVVIDALTGERK